MWSLVRHQWRPLSNDDKNSEDVENVLFEENEEENEDEDDLKDSHCDL